MKTYVKVGRSLCLVSNLKNCMEKGTVWLVVDMAMTLPKVPKMATILIIKSSLDTPLFTLVFAGDSLEASPASRVSGFIFLAPRI